MKDFIKIFGAIVGILTGTGLFIFGGFWLIIKIIDYNYWLTIPLAIFSFALYGAVLLLPYNDN